MAEYLIQGETLDDIADAINAKTGGSSAMTPAQMVTAIGSISGGGASVENELIDGTLSGTYRNEGVTYIRSYGMANLPQLTRVEFPNVTSAWNYAFSGCSNLETAFMPKLASTNIQTFMNCSKLRAFDLTVLPSIKTQEFRSCSVLNLLVIRKTNSLVTLAATNAFDSTPFGSGGSGGTIYIPEALYNHLGDGTSLDYKAATNWSTIDALGTITWAKIEGSIYETQYADGTPIPTT